MTLAITGGKSLAAVEADAQTGIANAATAQATADAAVPATQKGAANGVATLGAGTKVPAGQISGVLASSDLTNDAALEKTANKNAASGYAGLSAGSKIASSQMSGVLASSDLTNDAALEKTANKGAASGYASLDGAQLVVQDPASPALPRWKKFTLNLAALQALGAVGTADLEIYSLPAGGTIHAAKVKHSQALASVVGPVSAATASVGKAGNLTKYATAFDVFQAVSGTAFGILGVVGSENHGAAASIRVEVVLTGDTFDNLTAGVIDVWLLVGTAL